MKAIIIGASGSTGNALVEHLITNSLYTEIICLVRKSLKIKHPKIKELFVDFNTLDSYKNEIIADVAFSCLGTTLKVAGSKSAQWKIDYEYQLSFARIVRNNGVPKFVLVSSVGADPKSNFFYTKMKGQLENAILELGFKQTIIFQPPSLIRPNSNRNGEKISVTILIFLNSIGILKNMRPIHVTDLATYMLLSLDKLPEGNHILKPNDIRKIKPIL